MFQNTFKIAFRNLVKNKVHSAINIAGLAIGMAGAIVIFQLVTYHLGVDRYHQKSDRTYRVVVDLHLEDGSVEKEKGSAFLLHQTLKKDYSYVENAAYLAQKQITIAVGNTENPKRFLEKESAAFTNADFFEMFDYDWISGEPAVLDVPNQVVLTESYARKYFGKNNPVGQYIKIDNQENVVIAGVVKDYPELTDFRKDVFISLPTLKKIAPDYGYTDWGWIDSGRETYITLRSAADSKVFESQMPAFSKKYYGADGKVFHYHLQELSDVHFNIDYGGKIKYSTIIMLGSVGFLLVLIACFNFINLSTAQAFKRGKEVGVRKVLGISQAQVFWLFIQETALFTIISFTLATALAMIMGVVLSDWLGIRIQTLNFADYRFTTFIALLIAFVIALAGFYPAMMISNFNPILAIKGLVSHDVKGHFSVRKGLVVVQFSISFVLIAVSMVIILQSRYLRNKDLGLDKDLIMHVNFPETNPGKISTFRNEVMRLKEVSNVSFFRTPPSAQLGSGGSIKFENRDWEKFVARSRVADDHYIKTYGLKLVAGRNVSVSDTLRELLVNHKLVKALGLKSPEDALNRTLLVGDMGKTGVIVGVLSDFNNSDLYTQIEPTVVFSNLKYYRQAGIKLQHLNASTIQDIQKIWQKEFPDNVFQHSFYDDEIAGFYQREELTSNLTSLFSILSVFLSCLGLFGLAVFSIEQRTKEIGVRKVLGASVLSITGLLSKDFLKLVLIAILIASPAAYYFMDKWLQDFVFRIDIEWWIFALSATIAAAIALLTVSFHSIKAALMNPVKSLKSE